MKTFYHYLAESKHEYLFHVKVAHELTDDELDKIEQRLMKYDLIDISKPKELSIPEHQLEFRDLMGEPVWKIEITTHLPVSSYILQQEVRDALNLPERYVLVRSDNEPMELETRRLFAEFEIDKLSKEQDLTPEALLNSGLEYPEYDNKDIEFGDEYNKKLLNYLAQVKKDRNNIVEPIDKKLFGWLENDSLDFNKEYDTVKPVYKPKEVSNVGTNKSKYGNYDSTKQNVKKVFKDKRGNTVVIDSSGEVK